MQSLGNVNLAFINVKYAMKSSHFTYSLPHYLERERDIKSIKFWGNDNLVHQCHTRDVTKISYGERLIIRQRAIYLQIEKLLSILISRLDSKFQEIKRIAKDIEFIGNNYECQIYCILLNNVLYNLSYKLKQHFWQLHSTYSLFHSRDFYLERARD